MLKGKAHVIIDGQFGSTGKGLLAAYLAGLQPLDVCTTNASANAGHTTVLESGEQFVCYHLPTAGVIQAHSTIYLNAGSIIDPDLLEREIAALGVSAARVRVDPNAAIIRPEDRRTEGVASSPATRIGSTQKGVGEALVRKARRTDDATAGQCPELLPAGVRVERIDLNERLRSGETVMVEIPQGAGLGINTTYFYPYCTSREVSVMQGLADAMINPEHLGEVIMSFRTYPIRVGNIYGAGGEMLGYSGPGYSDQKELDWDDLGVTPEITTVTKRVRRVFDWSSTQIRHVFDINRPTIVFLNFCNYLKSPHDLRYRVNDITRHARRDIKMLFGFGPKVSDILDSYPEALKRVEDRNGRAHQVAAS